MVQFPEVFPDEQIAVTLSRQLSWSHFITIIPLDDDLKRGSYSTLITRYSILMRDENIGWKNICKLGLQKN